MKANLIEVIPDKCRGCRLCEMACSFRHERECSMVKSRIKILKDNDWAFDCPLLCIHCASSPCLESCPTGAISRDEKTGVVSIDPDVCTGCETCISVCPVHGIALDEGKGIAFKCDLCGGEPECVKWCPNEALLLKEVEIDSAERKAFVDQVSKYLRAVGL